MLDKAKMEAFETFAQKKGQQMVENLTRKSVPSLERKGSRKRKTEEAFSGDEAPAGKAKAEVGEAATSISRSDGAEDGSPQASMDQDKMEGIEGDSELYTEKEEREDEALSSDELTAQSPANTGSNIPPSPADFTLQPQLFQPGRGREKLSWPYLYKQRRRLEANWEKGIYSMFQLPHRDHPQEGHEECVYTIQHTTSHLVSGSRDKTIRIWDLNTNRLKGKPLRGHDASVLCLQFDERPEHDIIVSGGSDAYIIIWKFSTGEIIKKMTDAHDESVLNLRFDDRYIVTCSKDKTIKVWNRHALQRDSPLIPTHALHNFTDPALANLASPIKEYSLLTTFTGHHAAVNAVMIHESTIVSASGDRTIKAWDLHTGIHKKSYSGHQKGIACVQFDGRRIVSGSSDNTVRIFDAEQQAEIACLAGHTNLVRTVQARFGDLETTTDAELQAEAREADRKFYKALSKGMQPASAARRGPRNAGSSRPEDMQSVGTKIPPGGGGSRWAKIVSGSYDETVIVWKRDSEGKWQVKLRLHQDQLLRANRAHRRREHFAVNGNAAPANGQNASQPNQILETAQTHLEQVHHLLQHQHHLGGAAPAQAIQVPAMANAQNNLNNQLNHSTPPPQPPAPQAQQQTSVTTTTAGPTTTFTAAQPHTHGNPPPVPGASWTPLPPWQQALHPPLPSGFNGGPQVQYFPAHPAPAAGGQNANVAANPNQPANANQPANPNQPAANAHGQGAGAGAPRVSPESNRVFKLQFDARRIVCCSQNRTIVGWDFANGEEALERVGEWSVETA